MSETADQIKSAAIGTNRIIDFSNVTFIRVGCVGHTERSSAPSMEPILARELGGYQLAEGRPLSLASGPAPLRPGIGAVHSVTSAWLAGTAPRQGVPID